VFNKRSDVLEAIRSHWETYVLLCDGYLLYRASRKLIGVLSLLSSLRGNECSEASLCSVYVESVKCRLPTLHVKANGRKYDLAFYIDPTEVVDTRLKFRIIILQNGEEFAEKDVAWSEKSGPDLIHAAQLLDLIEKLESIYRRTCERQAAFCRLEEHLRMVGMINQLQVFRTGEIFVLAHQGKRVGTVGLLESGESFISNFSYEMTAHALSSPLKRGEVDALVM